MHRPNTKISVFITSNVQVDVPVMLYLKVSVAPEWCGVLAGSLILLFMYGLIITEVLHRTFASIIASTMAVAALSVLNERPSLAKIMGYIDIETLALLFSMMIIVAVIAKTGVFDYLAVVIYKVSVSILIDGPKMYLSLFMCVDNWGSRVAVNKLFISGN